MLEKGQPHKAGGRRPIAGQAGRAAARKALGQHVAAQVQGVIVQVADVRVARKVLPMPGIWRAVGQHADRVPVEVQPVRIRLDDHRLPCTVGKAPVQRGRRAQDRPGDQRHPLAQGIGRLLDGRAGGQQIGHGHGRLQGQRARPRLVRESGKFPEIQLPAHQPLFVDALIQDGRGLQQAGPHSKAGIAGLLPCALDQVALARRATGIERRATRHKGHGRSLRQAVEIKIAPPQMAAICRLPGQRAASGHPAGPMQIHHGPLSPAKISGFPTEYGRIRSKK